MLPSDSNERVDSKCSLQNCGNWRCVRYLLCVARREKVSKSQSPPTFGFPRFLTNASQMPIHDNQLLRAVYPQKHQQLQYSSAIERETWPDSDRRASWCTVKCMVYDLWIPCCQLSWDWHPEQWKIPLVPLLSWFCQSCADWQLSTCLFACDISCPACNLPVVSAIIAAFKMPEITEVIIATLPRIFEN